MATILDTLIYDRTQADVDKIRRLTLKAYQQMSEAEKTEWNKELKGSMNASDLNRVIEATDYVAEQMKNEGYYARFKPLKKTWLVNEIPNKVEMENYIYNVQQALQYGASLDLPNSMQRFDYTHQNNIERYLHDTRQFMENKKASNIHAGTCFAGFQGGLRR